MRIAAIIPVKNKADVLAACLPSVFIARRRRPETSIVLVDNGSTDGSIDILARYASNCTIIHSDAARVGGVRNDGALADPRADVYAFLDCDCVIPEGFFDDVAALLESTDAAAVGCEVLSPRDGHWSEIAWDGLHRPGGDGPRHYINSACFCIRREWFEQLKGFDAEKISSEDVDICRRLAAHGGSMWQSEKLAVLHLGNPQSLAGLYRRIRWHGSGVWERGKGMQWSVSTVATILHPLVIVIGATLGTYVASRGGNWGLGLVLIAPLIVPLLFVAARALQHRRRVPMVGGTALMVITFAARLDGLIRSIVAPTKLR